MSSSSPKDDAHTSKRTKTKASGFRTPTAPRSIVDLFQGQSSKRSPAASRDDTVAALSTGTKIKRSQPTTDLNAVDQPPSPAATPKPNTSVHYGKPSFAGILPSTDFSNTSASQLEDEIVSAAVNKQYREYDEHDPDWMPKTPTATKAGQVRSSSNKKRKQDNAGDEAEASLPKRAQKRNPNHYSGSGSGTGTTKSRSGERRLEDQVTIVLEDDGEESETEIAPLARSPSEELPVESVPRAKTSTPPAPAQQAELDESYSNTSNARYLQYRAQKSQLKAEIARKFADLADLRAEFRRSEYDVMLRSARE